MNKILLGIGILIVLVIGYIILINTTNPYTPGVVHWHASLEIELCGEKNSWKCKFCEHFIRIKEAKKKGEKWETFGEIMITKDRINEVRGFLEKVQKNIENYRR